MRGVCRLINYEQHKLVHKFYRRIKECGSYGNIESKVLVYEFGDYVLPPILYHHLNTKVYNEIFDALKLDEKLLDTLIDMRVQGIIFTDLETGECISASTTEFINNGIVSKGKVYLPLDYCEYIGTEDIPYIPRFRWNDTKANSKAYLLDHNIVYTPTISIKKVYNDDE